MCPHTHLLEDPLTWKVTADPILLGLVLLPVLLMSCYWFVLSAVGAGEAPACVSKFSVCLKTILGAIAARCLFSSSLELSWMPAVEPVARGAPRVRSWTWWTTTICRCIFPAPLSSLLSSNPDVKNVLSALLLAKSSLSTTSYIVGPRLASLVVVKTVSLSRWPTNLPRTPCCY
jgi:hypothetical protein